MNHDIKRLLQEAAAETKTGRVDEAIELYRKITLLAPGSATAEHNLAAALGDAGRWLEAGPHIRAAFSKGIDAAESWLVLARCLQAQGQHVEAAQAYRSALRRRPTMYDAYRELAQLQWMCTGERKAALDDLDAARSAMPNDPHLSLLRAQVVEYTGDLNGAMSQLKELLAVYPHDAPGLNVAAQVAASLGDYSAALGFAQRLVANAPNEPVAKMTLATAQLAAGLAEQASIVLGGVRAQSPNDQYAIALQSTAWRILGDKRYSELCDYQGTVVTSPMDTPEPWTSLEHYLTELAHALDELHCFRTHPFAQSVRMGSQVSDVWRAEHPALRALPAAFDGPTRRYLSKLGQGPDPVRARNTGRYAFRGMWSIRLRAGGYHVDHVHPQGWISSACYIQVPRLGDGREGWLRLGKPGVPTTPLLDAEHFVAPSPGQLVLFPSYMWHGTIPFTDPSFRTTIAFDLVPG